MRIINRLLTTGLGLFLVSAGIAKFTGGHVFQFIAYRSGIDWFYPLVNHATGVLEIVAGALMLFRRTRLVGSMLVAGLMAGAVAFHLSPWLGVSVPTSLADGAEEPWDASDFVADTTMVTFGLAIVIGLWSVSVAQREYRRRRDLAGAPIEGPAASTVAGAAQA